MGSFLRNVTPASDLRRTSRDVDRAAALRRGIARTPLHL